MQVSIAMRYCMERNGSINLQPVFTSINLVVSKFYQ